MAVELLLGTIPLSEFEHPEIACYLFGPEDGSIPKSIRLKCHRFVAIPRCHCLNLAAAVSIVLYDRVLNRDRGGFESLPELAEAREVWNNDAAFVNISPSGLGRGCRPR